MIEIKPNTILIALSRKKKRLVHLMFFPPSNLHFDVLTAIIVFYLFSFGLGMNGYESGTNCNEQ